MISYPTSDQVVDDLGDKVVDALARSVAGARADLADYRLAMPGFVADASKRGLANWIHDRFWSHAAALLDDQDDVVVVDEPPLREIAVGINYMLRFKRHHDDDRVSTFPTQGALDFIEQRALQLSFDGLGQINLIAGYRWLEDSFDIGPAVLSLRNVLDRVVWVVDLDELAGSSTVGRIPDRPGPTPPVVEVRRHPDDDTGESHSGRQ